MVNADSGIQGSLFSGGACDGNDQLPGRMLIAYYPRNSFDRKEEIGRAEELLH
jgi:hypothetical protein